MFLLNRPVRRGSIVKHRGRLAQVTHVDIRATALAAHLDGRSVIQGVLLDDLKEQSVIFDGRNLEFLDEQLTWMLVLGPLRDRIQRCSCPTGPLARPH